MRRSFAVRLAVAFAAVGLAAAAVTALLVNVAFDSRFTGYLEQRQEERRVQLVESLAAAHRQAGGWDPQELHRVTAVALMDGGTLAVEDPAGRPVWASEADPRADMHGRMMGSGPLGEARRVPVEVDGAVVGVAAVRLPQPGVLPQDVTFRSSVNRMIIAGAIIAGVAALLLGLMLARRTTAPARALTRTARAVAAGERSARVPHTRDDEFGEMAQAFNRMADEVEAEDRLRRDFAADVAHELRTPLMILRGEIEALEDGIVQPTSTALASLRDEALRLARLVDDLETLARADAAGFSLDRRPTDLTQVVTEAADELAPAFAARSLSLAVSRGPALVAAVDPVRVKQIVTNLLSNAAKFAPEGGRVRVDVDREADAADIAVWNSGPPIPADDLARIFDRFYRGRQPQGGGSGIGLTVARDLAEAHDGEVAVSSTSEHGTMFRLRLPLSRNEARPAAAAPTGQMDTGTAVRARLTHGLHRSSTPGGNDRCMELTQGGSAMRIRVTALAVAIVTVLVLGVGAALATPRGDAGLVSPDRTHSSEQMGQMHAQMPAELQAECDAMHAQMGSVMGRMPGQDGMGQAHHGQVWGR